MTMRQFVSEIPYICAVMHTCLVNEPDIPTQILMHNSMNFFTRKVQEELYVPYRAMCDCDSAALYDSLMRLMCKYYSSMRVRLFINTVWLHFQGEFNDETRQILHKLSKEMTEPTTKGEFYEYLTVIPMLVRSKNVTGVQLVGILRNMTNGKTALERNVRENVTFLLSDFTDEQGDSNRAAQKVYEKVKCGEELIFYMRLIHLLKEEQSDKEAKQNAERRHRRCPITKLRPDDEELDCAN